MYDNHAVCTMGNGHTIMKTIAIIDKSHVPGFHIGFFPWGGCRCVQGGGGGGGAMGLILLQKIGNYDVIIASTATIRQSTA